ncbi:hypothetical protein GCM10027589_01160 [Actinocorallia lasiicapitis]
MRIRTIGLVAAAAVTLLSAAPAAAAPHALSGGGIEFGYGKPDVSDEGDHVAWAWTVRNTGAVAAEKVVLTHTLSPALPITYVSPGCQVSGAVVRCTWAKVAPGQSRQGAVEADVPGTLNGSVQINGRIVWQTTTARPAAS